MIAVVDAVKPSQPITNIDWKYPARLLLLSLLLPVMLAFCLDILLGSLPLVTMVASIICIPLATVLVIRSVLVDFSRVIEIVAPEEAEQGDDAAADNDSNTGDNWPDASA